MTSLSPWIAPVEKKCSTCSETLGFALEPTTVGYNVNEGDVFHVCIDSVFDSLEDLNTYIDHPEHQKVRAFMNEVSYDKTVFDYEF